MLICRRLVLESMEVDLYFPTDGIVGHAVEQEAAEIDILPLASMEMFSEARND